MTKTISAFPVANGEGATFLARVLLALIQVYRYTLSPAQIFLFGTSCRFTPTCSQYAMDAIKTHGAVSGSALAVKRICRCHPFGQCGHDPVPALKTENHPGD